MLSQDELLNLTDWRRRIAELYAEVRRVSASDPAAAHATWRREREALYRYHPASPLPAGERSAFRAHQWPYRDAWRHDAALEAPEDRLADGHADRPPIFFVPASTGGAPPLEPAGSVSLDLPGGAVRLPVLRLLDYAGGIFVPFCDGTNGDATYAAGRYLLDTAKSADLGATADGRLILDFNFAFQPSCAFDPKWACPLAPPESRLAIPIEAGERLR